MAACMHAGNLVRPSLSFHLLIVCAGRTVRVEVRKNKVTEFLTLAVSRAGFSWVVYEEARSGRNALDVVRLSVIPISEH